MEQISYNLTIIKAFREEIMSPIDVYNGKLNEKHNIPFKDYFVLYLNPRLFMTVSSIVAAFTSLSEDLINSWYHEFFIESVNRTTEFMSFYKGMIYYDKVISKRKKPIFKKNNPIDGNNNAANIIDESYLPMFQDIKKRNPNSTPENP
jgi:hypothetical protein